MVRITKPVIENRKTVSITTEKYLNNHHINERKPIEQTINYPDILREKYEIKKEDLERAIEETNRLIFNNDNHFKFKIHERTGRIMVKLVNNNTDEIIKEIPPEKILDLIANIWDLVGILVDERG